jgi:hypothetical protein
MFITNSDYLLKHDRLVFVLETWYVCCEVETDVLNIVMDTMLGDYLGPSQKLMGIA